MALFLGACVPSPEERVARAEAHMAKADYRSAILELKNASRDNPDLAPARLLLAEASYQMGDLLTAEAEYKRALGLGEDRPEVWVAFGRTLLEMGKAQDAFSRVIPNLADDENNETGLVLKGDVLGMLGNLAEAQSAYTAALAVNSESPRALIGNATLLAVAGEHSQAEELIERATQAHPESAFVWSAKGNYLAARRQHLRAVAAYSQSIAVESNTTPLLHRFQARVNRTTALIEGHRLDDAAEQLSELTERYPPHSILRYLEGRLAFARGDYELAQQELQEYLAQVPRDAYGQALLGAVHFSRDNLRQAEMYLMQAVRANAGGEATRRLLAETLLRLNKPEAALVELKSSETFGAQDPMLLAMLGRAEIGRGDTGEAIRYFEEGIAADPSNPALNLALAAAYLQGNRADDAIRVLQEMPDTPGSLYRRETLLIGAYLRDGQREKAIAQGNELLRANPDDAQAFTLVGVLRNATGDAELAQQLFEDALSLDPENLGALFNLGTMAYSKKDFEKSTELFARLMDAHPANLAGLVSMAAALQQQDRLEDLRPRIEAAIEAAPGSVEPRVLLVRLEVSQDRIDEALEQIDVARDLFPDEPGLDHLEGRIHMQQDRPAAAVDVLRRAVSAAPGNARYVFDLASAQLTNAEFGAAAASARDYRVLRPEDVRGLSLLVEAEIRAGSPGSVEGEVAAYLAAHQDVAAAHLAAGDVQLASGLPDKALPHYEKAASLEWSRRAAFQLARARRAAGGADSTEPLARWLAENSEDHNARFFYAQLLESEGDTDAAVREYERLYSSGQLNAIGLNNLAWRYSQSGKEEALDLARRAHELAPDNGSISDTLGWILFERGQTDEALPLLERAAEQSPDDPEIQFHLAVAYAKAGNKVEADAIITGLLETDQPFPSREQAEALAKSL